MAPEAFPGGIRLAEVTGIFHQRLGTLQSSSPKRLPATPYMAQPRFRYSRVDDGYTLQSVAEQV